MATTPLLDLIQPKARPDAVYAYVLANIAQGKALPAVIPMTLENSAPAFSVPTNDKIVIGSLPGVHTRAHYAILSLPAGSTSAMTQINLDYLQDYEEIEPVAFDFAIVGLTLREQSTWPSGTQFSYGVYRNAGAPGWIDKRQFSATGMSESRGQSLIVLADSPVNVGSTPSSTVLSKGIDCARPLRIPVSVRSATELTNPGGAVVYTANGSDYRARIEIAAALTGVDVTVLLLNAAMLAFLAHYYSTDSGATVPWGQFISLYEATGGDEALTIEALSDPELAAQLLGEG